MSFQRPKHKCVPLGLGKARCRLLYLVGQLGMGGLERQLYYLLQAMDKQRYLPIVVVWNHMENDVYVRRIQELGVQVSLMPDRLSSVAKLLAFCRLVISLRPEVIHSCSFFTNFAAYFGALLTRTVAIGSVRGDFRKSKDDTGLLLGSLNARWPRTQIYNSFMAEKQASHFSGLFVAKDRYVVRNGLDLTRFSHHSLTDEARPIILGVGSLLPVKRWDRLLKVAAELKRNGIDFLIRIVGDGPLRNSLKQQASDLGVNDCVEFLWSRDDIASLLADSCFLAHTSDSEGCPNVVIEAMACGRAVVATDAGDIPNLVEDGKTGFVVGREDEKEMVERISNLIENRKQCRRMGEAGRDRAEREFSLERLVSETFIVYQAAGWKNT